MAAAHTSAQGSSILKARAAANSALSAPASRAASVAGPSAPQSRVGTKSLPSAPASVTVSEASSVQEDQDNGDEVVVLEPDDITAGGGEDDAISVPESEDPPVEEQETQKPATRGSKRIARSSDPPQDVDKTGPGTASKQHDGKGKSTSMGPPISKRPRKGSTASDAIDLELESDDARAAAAADLNSSKVLPPAHDDFWDDIRRMATSVDPLLNTSTPNAGPSRQRATIEAAPQEPNRSIQTAIRGRGRGKSAPPEKTQTAGRGGKKGTRESYCAFTWFTSYRQPGRVKVGLVRLAVAQSQQNRRNRGRNKSVSLECHESMLNLLCDGNCSCLAVERLNHIYLRVAVLRCECPR